MEDDYLEIRQDKLKELSKTLKIWIRNIKQFSKDFENDALYWYNERASLSVFAGAVWLSGGYALEEFSATKGSLGEEWKGRKDLWFCLNQQEYIVEAKFKYQSFSPQAKIFDKIKQTLNEACSDAKKSVEKDNISLGLCFIAPYLPKSKEKDMESLIESLKKELLKIDYDFLAWIFPEVSGRLSYPKNNIPIFYPGGVVLGKIA
ncbi:MAG: hypothetical protein KKB82_03250 [Candidatus Omnitrophica bacterium]|nr:hypothetical protein [Candidatus Omnitrophota bacterium]MBU1924922.1 hypothetical protein [Candidatus Omnitrophota bacterium]